MENLPTEPTRELLDSLYRVESGRILATLIRLLGERTTVQTSLLGIAKKARSEKRQIMFARVTLGLHADASIHEEPGAGKLHAGICAGAVR